ncbi:hypothetical protein ACFWOB_22585 [Streptomyces sp. NPDC058420]|uniref:hypothetical protein n=1 Tax=Streptomyces sp. NPDC058420 TaxID=3346489 RepID=UPI00366728CE
MVQASASRRRPPENLPLDRVRRQHRPDDPQDILRAAPTGTVDPAVDPDDAFDTLLGAVLTRTLLSTVTARNRPVERTVDMILRMLRPLDGPV